jgi:hypothetical protein
MLFGALFITLGLICTLGGYFLKQHLYPDWGRARIGAVDGLFSVRGLLTLLLYLLFHALWFFLSLFFFVMGVVYLLR